MNLVSPGSFSSVDWMQGSLAVQKQQSLTCHKTFFNAPDGLMDRASRDIGLRMQAPTQNLLVVFEKWYPTALLLSSAMMLRHLQFPTFADRLETTVKCVVAEGKARTKDLDGESTTQEVVDAVIEQCDSSSSLLQHFAFVIDKCPVSQRVGLKGEAMNLVSPDSISSVEWMQGSLAVQKQQPSLVLGFL
ncbi:hypothetical protein ACFE04_004683 [Oxalis oulophora]